MVLKIPARARIRALVALLAIVALPATPLAAGAQDVGLELGTKAPTARVETMDGKPAELTSYFAGAPAVIEFWAGWCSNCKQLEPQLAALHAKYGKRVRFVGVAVSINQSRERARAYIERHRLPGTWLFDRDGDASGAYDAPATSYVVVLDRAGRVVYTGVGGTQKLESAILEALR